jgi:hypothetical protein
MCCVYISVTRIVGDGRDEKGQSTGTKEIDSYNIDARQQQPTASQFLTLLCKLQLLVMCYRMLVSFIFSVVPFCYSVCSLALVCVDLYLLILCCRALSYLAFGFWLGKRQENEPSSGL